MKFQSQYFIPAEENVFEIHVLVSIMVCHVQTLLLNQNPKITFFVIVTLMTMNQSIYHLMTKYKTFRNILPYVPIFLFTGSTSLLFCHPLKKQKSQKTLISCLVGNRHCLLMLLISLCANVALIQKPVYHYMRAILYYMRFILLYYNYYMRATLALNGLNYIIKRCCQKIKFR